MKKIIVYIMAFYATHLCALSDEQRIGFAFSHYQQQLPKMSQEGELVERITPFMLSFMDKESLSKHDTEGVSALRMKLVNLFTHNQPLIFCLKGFPFKSRLLTRSQTAGISERLGIMTLNHMCSEISKIYKPGAQIKIFSDGLPYTLPWDPTNEVKQAYVESIKGLCAGTNVKIFSLLEAEAYKNLSDAPSSVQALQERVSAFQCPENPIKKDLQSWIASELRSHQMEGNSAKITQRYQMCQAQYSAFLDRYCYTPDWIALTVHDYGNLSKIPIQLLHGMHVTPWYAKLVCSYANIFHHHKKKLRVSSFDVFFEDEPPEESQQTRGAWHQEYF